MVATHSELHRSKPAVDKIGKLAPSMSPTIEAALTKHRREFYLYLVRRLGDSSTAEDVLQSFCLRVISSGTALRKRDRVVPWLYIVLRSVLTDHYRSEASRRRREAGYAQEQLALGDGCPNAELEGSFCDCYRELIPQLRREYAEVLRRIDMAGEPRKKVASDLGITPTNLAVRLHRARRALRNTLDERCGGCCAHDYYDCSCHVAPGDPSVSTFSRATLPTAG